MSDDVFIPVYHTGDEAFCVSKEDGIYADPSDQTAFYMCKGEKATKKFCPTGLKFNPMISSCDVPEDVRFTGNEAESLENYNTKGNTKWTSLPGNDGLKVLSVSGPEEFEKHEDKPVLQDQKPHKIFSINIFHGAHTIAKNETGSDKKTSGFENGSTLATRLPKVNSNLIDSTWLRGYNNVDLKNSSNRTTGQNRPISAAEKVQSATVGKLEDFNDQPRAHSQHILSKSISKFQDHFKTDTENSEQHLFTTDLSTVQAAGKGNLVSGRLRISPRKFFAINVFGLHPKVRTSETHIYSANENAEIGGYQDVDPAQQSRDAPFIGSKVSMQPLSGETNNNGILKTPEMESAFKLFPQQNEHTELATESKPFQDEVLTPNIATSSPLHFKLIVNMDRSGRQPIINCNLSECSENDFAMKDDPSKEKGSQSQQNGSLQLFGFTGKPNYKQDSQEQSSGKEFHITLKTDGSEGVKGLHVIPDQGNDLQQIPFKAQEVKNPSELEHISHDRDQPQGYQRNDDTTKTPLNEEDQGKLALKEENNVYTMDVENEDQEGKPNNEAKKIHLKEDSTNEIFRNKSLADGRFPVSKSYEGYSKNLTGELNRYNGSNLENADPFPLKENESGRGVDNNISTGQINSKLQISSIHDTLQLQHNLSPEKGMKTHFQGERQRNDQSYVQAVSNRPQLKIILKNPGKLGVFMNPGSQLKRTSDARGDIVQILKSLIDRPLNLGRNGKDVVSKLSSLVNKPTSSSKGDQVKQTEMESIKDSGSIAQSILEANKEYLDDIAMQGMVFSDGDPENVGMNDIADTIKQGDDFLHQISEFPKWENSTLAGKGTAGFHGQSPEQSELNQDFRDDETQDDGDGSKLTLFSLLLLLYLHKRKQYIYDLKLLT